MSKVICNLAISLDGYIAKLDHSVEFLSNSSAEAQESSFQEFLSSIDVIVMGSTSYDQMIELGGNQFEDKLTYVLTTQEYADEENVIFIEKELDELLIDVKEKAEKNIWLFGGAKVLKQFIELDAVDEFIITIVPVIIGTGIPLFLFTKEERELELISAETHYQNVTLHYRRKR